MTDVFDDGVAELRQRFLIRAAGDSISLDEFASGLERGAHVVLPRSEIRRIAHWLAGTGGTFGFARISASATELEALISDLPESPRLVNSCREVILEIRQAKQQGRCIDG